MKKKLIAGIALLAIIMCGCTDTTTNIITETSMQTTTVTDEGQTVVQTTVAEKEETEGAVQSAAAAEQTDTDSMYNCIMKDTYWRKNNTQGATILDINSDGNPEFIVHNFDSASGCSSDFYSFGADKLEYLYSTDIFDNQIIRFKENNENYFYVYKLIQPDDNSRTDKEYHYIYRLTDTGFELDREAFYGTFTFDEAADLYTSELFVNGEKYGSDYIENYSLNQASERKVDEWYKEMSEWESEHLKDADVYKTQTNSSWNAETDISSDIEKLVKAYLDGDKDYFSFDYPQ